ncbi:hypothetical protein [Frateuria sp. STR12]|uniref:hypothetical protein n=1 Tax=Frateuria hangzhouensis TaxID=2995589 RepID=UPI002260E056|nr:hypothetical protein [Frateuria sp. STR12]MCX7512888.1 hypothetical protein [Frateuria sp. STR12]
MFIPVFLVAALLIFLPFSTNQEFLRNRARANTPAGEFNAGARLVQSGYLPRGTTSTAGQGNLCVGIQFATYARRNSGQLGVHWSQPGRTNRWRVESSELEDNQFKYFCPQDGIELDSGFEIAVIGIDGKSGHSPTAWLTADTSLGTVRVNGQPRGKSLVLSFAARKHVTAARILRTNHGAFALGLLLSVIIGLVALLSMKQHAAESA